MFNLLFGYNIQIAREPCFHPCISTINTLCLAKAFFPFYQKPYEVDGYPKNPISPKILRNVVDHSLREENEAVDLTDILDVPSVVKSIGSVESLFTPGQTTRHLTFAANRGSVVGYRKKCHQTGVRTLIAGPWAPISSKKLHLQIKNQESFSPYLLNLNAEYALTNILSSQQGIYKPWKPCFFACDDTTITCWPKQKSKLNRLQYFGNRIVNLDNRKCIPWAEAFHFLWELNTDLSLRNISFNQTTPNRILEARNLFYYQQLSERPQLENRTGFNLFLDGLGQYLFSSRCLDMSNLIEYEDTTTLVEQSVFEDFYKKGPGCFTKNPDHGYLEYSPCFRACPCSEPSMESPPSVVQQLCSNGARFEKCTKKYPYVYPPLQDRANTYHSLYSPYFSLSMLISSMFLTCRDPVNLSKLVNIMLQIANNVTSFIEF